MPRLAQGARWGAVVATVALAAVATGCGDSEQPVGGSATVAMATPPDSLDPQHSYTTEGAAADWIAYTPLLTYRHRGGADGTELIPGLATKMPKISPEGRRYRLTLRDGLVFSDGRPVRASDFEYTIERALRLNWGGESFLTENVAGAAEYDRGETTRISGIATDDATGRITILLKRPYGAFANVLALPGTGLVPGGTPMRDLTAEPPPGVGAYRITDVVPGKRWAMVQNPRFEPLELPDIPVGELDRIDVRITPDANAAADQVLRGRADGFDPGTPLPPPLLRRARQEASGRFEEVPIPSTLYFFLNTSQRPFSSELARRAVLTALNRAKLAELGNGSVRPGCFLIPEGIVGHSSGSCPWGGAEAKGDLVAARQLVKASGAGGTPVLVWVENSSPQRAYARYYTKLLTRIGFPAHTKVVASATEYVRPQTGYASWFNDFPNPVNFYEVLNAESIGGPGSPNAGGVRDIFIQQQLERLGLTPAQDLGSAAGDWRDLDEYSAKKAYLAVFGQQQVPRLMSGRVDFDSAVIHPLFLSDWSSWSLR